MKQWLIETAEHNREDIPHYGNKFLNGNGYIGIRGTMEEFGKEHMPAINLAGVYDQVGDLWRESVNAPNPFYTVVSVDGTAYRLPDVEPVEHVQQLQYRQGLQLRKTVWQTAKGSLTVESERFASMADCHILGLSYTVTCGFDGEIELKTGIDGDVWDINGPHFVTVTPVVDTVDSVSGTTGESKVTVLVQAAASCSGTEQTELTDKGVYKVYKIAVQAGVPVTMEKVCAVSTSLDGETPSLTGRTYAAEKARHIAAWEAIWDTSYVQIEGDPAAEEALNYSIYHLNCIAPRHAKSLSIPARGLSGQVYKGAVFWDTEMFMLDYYLYTAPEIARTLLRYRIDTLPGAQEKARQYGWEGAFYAWESQEGGYDACSDYNVIDVFTKRPMRTYFKDKQVHISAAVVFALMKYLKATGDTSILQEGGAEMVVECALFYRSLLLKYANKDVYEIHDVIGPDEYHERINNNAYTSKMAQFVLQSAVEVLEQNADALAGKYDVARLKQAFADGAANLFVQAPQESGLIEQFDGYFKLEDCSIDDVRSRLLDPKEYWGGANGMASETQVIKQADVVTMLAMFHNEYSKDIMEKNWDYYQPRTEHGSSLSACMYALLACYIGRPEEAYPFFMKSAKADLLPGGKEWAGLLYIGGTHPAAEGGAWIVAAMGLAGFEIRDGKPAVHPCLPQNWKKVTFKVVYKGTRYLVEATQAGGTVTPVAE